MADLHSDQAGTILPDLDAVGEWLAQMMPENPPTMDRLSQIERYLLNEAKIRGRTEVRYTVVSPKDDVILFLQLVVGGQRIDHGSIAMSCADGRFFKTYLSSPNGKERAEQRCYFAGATDVACFLAFTAREGAARRNKPLRVAKPAPVNRPRQPYRIQAGEHQAPASENGVAARKRHF